MKLPAWKPSMSLEPRYVPGSDAARDHVAGLPTQGELALGDALDRAPFQSCMICR